MDRKIAVLGSGNMGSALIRGMIKAKVARAADVVATTRQDEKARALAKDLGITVTTDNRKAAAGADVLVLGVKPQILPKVLEEIAPSVKKGKLVVSVKDRQGNVARIERTFAIKE